MDSFNNWLASYLQQNVSEVSKLTENQFAMEFLMTWSIFESDCFNGFCKMGIIPVFSKKLAATEKNYPTTFPELAKCFHKRYQSKKKYSNLVHGKKIPDLEKILAKEIKDLNREDEVYLLLVVVYRYRNNMFHGNKNVASWLQYEKQIRRCTTIMQNLIDISETSHYKRTQMTP
ncbi:MAG: hypothetical protein HN855_15655 [Anaerolineae bacterium]|nr:hypothetical protein [Anaerolineae bacterium]MBT7070689.1 hypothetical protein [Anaerolineae bacterium]MBT7326591.1 hypothetical protein [Anaerolineae bacterium]